LVLRTNNTQQNTTKPTLPEQLLLNYIIAVCN
jgi:hypothetical protein